MQIVIEISEPTLAWVSGDTRCLSDEEFREIVYAFQHCIPLPKGHGRLIDADKLKEWVQDVIKVNYTIEDRTDAVEQELLVLDWFDERIDSAPTIIEAEVGE